MSSVRARAPTSTPAGTQARAAAALRQRRRSASVRRHLLPRARARRLAVVQRRRVALDGRGRSRATSRARATPICDIPYHSRWRHFEAGGVDRRAELDARLAAGRAGARAHDRPGRGQRAARCRRGPRLALPAKPRPGSASARSEGLGVASLHAFAAARFSSDAARSVAGRCRRPGAARRAARLAEAFQVRAAQSAGGARRPRARCCAGWAMRCVAARGVRRAGPAGRPVRRPGDGARPDVGAHTTSCRSC